MTLLTRKTVPICRYKTITRDTPSLKPLGGNASHGAQKPQKPQKKANDAAALANEKAVAADTAAGRVNAAITQANTAATNAQQQASAAGEAAAEATESVAEMNAALARLEELEQTITAKDRKQPTGMELEFPKKNNKRKQRHSENKSNPIPGRNGK
ncbi:hypothetical protein ACIXCW_13425 [Bacteroides fragilis]